MRDPTTGVVPVAVLPPQELADGELTAGTAPRGEGGQEGS
jgi:hypothetical protein